MEVGNKPLLSHVLDLAHQSFPDGRIGYDRSRVRTSNGNTRKIYSPNRLHTRGERRTIMSPEVVSSPKVSPTVKSGHFNLRMTERKKGSVSITLSDQQLVEIMSTQHTTNKMSKEIGSLYKRGNADSISIRSSLQRSRRSSLKAKETPSVFMNASMESIGAALQK